MPEAGRVITGSAGGLRLEAPGPGTRPTRDRVKQALFALLEAERTDVWERPFLDLFAGTGAAGIEALSRGAPRAVLVERDAARARPSSSATSRAPASTARRASCGATCAAFLAGGPAGGARRRPSACVFVDPPYAQVDGPARRRSSASATRPRAGWTTTPLVVAKHFWKDALRRARRAACARVRERRFGETALSVYRRASRDRRWRAADAPRRLPGVVRPHHLRPPRRHRARQPPSSTGSSWPSSSTRARSPSRSGRRARRHHPRGHRRGARSTSATGVEVSTFDGLTVDLARAARRQRHRARPARAQRLRERAGRSPTSTASWRRRSTRCSS